MRKLTVLIPVAAFLLIVSQSAPQSRNIQEEVDPYTGLKTLFLEVSTRTCPGDPSPGSHAPEVHLLFSAEQSRNGTVSYFITPELDQAGYSLHIPAKGTMDALIDGAVAGFRTSSGSIVTNRYAGERSYLHETVPFNISLVDLGRLSEAKSFQFRVNGPRQEVQRCTDAKRMRDLAEFLDASKAYAATGIGTLSQPQLPPQNKPQLQTKPIVEEVNTSTGLKNLTLRNIATESCASDPVSGTQDGATATDVHLTISASQRSDGGVWYFISTDLSHDATLGLRPGGKLRTRIDGVEGVFNTIKGSVVAYRSDAGGQPVAHENTAFHVHQADLVALSKASTLDILIDGANGMLHRCVHADQFRYLRDFIGIAARYQPSTVATVKSASPQ